VLTSGEVEELEELRTLVVLLYTETASDHGEDCPAHGLPGDAAALVAARTFGQCEPDLCPQERARVLIEKWQEERKVRR
jgi:hypothetical protein